MITLEAMSIAELPTADPFTRGRAVACQLLTKQRRLPDDVGGAGRRRSLRLRRTSASCTGLGSRDEANSGEQRNSDTHRYTSNESDGTVPPGLRGISRMPCWSMSQVDSRYDGCVVISALHAKSCRAVTRSSPRLNEPLVRNPSTTAAGSLM